MRRKIKAYPIQYNFRAFSRKKPETAENQENFLARSYRKKILLKNGTCIFHSASQRIRGNRFSRR